MTKREGEEDEFICHPRGTLQLGGMFVSCKPATATAPAALIAKEETS